MEKCNKTLKKWNVDLGYLSSVFLTFLCMEDPFLKFILAIYVIALCLVSIDFLKSYGKTTLG